MKNLFISGSEVARIENGKYYIVNNNVAMKQVSKEKFIKELKKYESVCNNTWCNELKRDYAEMMEIF